MQHRSADGNIYRSTLTKAHFTHFPHFLSSLFFFLFKHLFLLPIAEHSQIRKGSKQSSGFVLQWGQGCVFSLAQKLTKGISGIHQKEVIMDVSHYINLHRLFCITNGCTVAFAVLFEYQWAAWSTLLSRGARSSFGYKSITINEAVETRCSESVQFLLDTAPLPLEREGRGEALHRDTGCKRLCLLLACWGRSCLCSTLRMD